MCSFRARMFIVFLAPLLRTYCMYTVQCTYSIRKPVAADPPQTTFSLVLLFSQRGKALSDVTPPFPIQSSPNHLVKPIDVDPDPGGKKLPERRRTFCHSNQSKVT